MGIIKMLILSIMSFGIAALMLVKRVVFGAAKAVVFGTMLAVKKIRKA